MLIYKRANFAPNGWPEQQSQEPTPEVKIQDLKREIKELSDNDAKNDGFESKIIVDNQLNGSLSTELLKPENKKTLNNLVKELSKILEKKNYDTNGADLLNLLTWVQKKAEFNRLNKIMTNPKEAGGIKLDDLWKFNDQEIKLVCDYIKDNIVSPECANLHKLFVTYKSMEQSITDKKAKENFLNIQKSLLDSWWNSTVAVEIELSHKQLAEIFTDLSVEKFNSIITEYTNLTDWKGTPLEGQIGFKNNWKNFTEGEFVAYFNGANESRKQANEAIATDFRLWDITQDTLKNFRVKDNKLLYNWQPCRNEDIKAVFWETKINPALKEWIFFWDEKAAIESKICDKITNEIKDKLQNSDQEVNKEKWTMKPENFDKIKSTLWDRMFINMDAEDKVTYIPQKAKAYLSEYRNKEWQDIKKDFNTPNWMAYVAALQILLNVDHDANINVDGIWKYSGQTQEAVRKFQENYNNNLPTDWVKIEKVDGLPWKITLEALLDGQYGDAGLDGQWKVNPDWTWEFLDWTEIKEKDGKKYITIDGQDYYEYTEGMEGPGYRFWKNDDHDSRLYVWNFKNGKSQWEWTCTRNNWEKYVWKREKDCRTEWTYTWPAGTPDNFREYVWKFDYKNDKYVMTDWTMTYEDNDKYKWAFNEKNEKQWKWTYTWANWNILNWTWERDHLEGEGTVSFPNTDIPDLKVVLDGDKLKVTSDLPAFKDKLIYVETWEFVDATNTTPEAPEKNPAVVEWIWKFEGDTFKFDNVNELNGNKYVNIWWKNYYEYRNGMNGDWYMVVPKTNEHSAYVLYWHYENGVIMNWTVHDAEGNKYEWEFKDGERSWKWKATMFDWTTLSCDTFVKGLPTWKCTIEYWSSEDWKDELGKWEKYEWEIQNRVPSWKDWTMTWKNWDKYTWEWKDGRMDWDWTYTFQNGTTIEWTIVWKFEKGKLTTWTLTFKDWQTFNWAFNETWTPDTGTFKKDQNDQGVHVESDEVWLKDDQGNYVYRREGQMPATNQASSRRRE